MRERGSAAVLLCLSVSRSKWVVTAKGPLASVDVRDFSSALGIHILQVFQSLLDLGMWTHANNAYRRLRNNNNWCQIHWFSTWNIFVRYSISEIYIYNFPPFAGKQLRRQIILLRFFEGDGIEKRDVSSVIWMLADIVLKEPDECFFLMWMFPRWKHREPLDMSGCRQLL